MFPFEQRLSKEEKKELVNRYASLETGYCILYIKAEFEKRGYKVITDREEVRIPLPDGRRIDYDFVLERDGKRILVDFDNGRLDKYSYFSRLDKMLTVSKDIYIIPKDEHTLYNHTKANAFKWIVEHLGGVDAAKGKVNLHFSTLEWLITNEQLWDSTEL